MHDRRGCYAHSSRRQALISANLRRPKKELPHGLAGPLVGDLARGCPEQLGVVVGEAGQQDDGGLALLAS